MSTITVSVCMITYNHGKYIEEAIKSIFSQQTNFNVQLVISNDNSTDNTDEIIQRLIKANESQITVKYLKQDVNLGMMDNFAFTLVQCDGDYIALCEGDDYWTDDCKLQKQVDFMKSSPELSFTFHASNVLYQNQLIPNYKHKGYKDREIVSTKDFLIKEGARYCTASAMFKREVVNPLADWFAKCYIGDYPLMFLALEKGKIGYLEEVMCVYRFSSEGSWSQRNLKVNHRILNIKKMVRLNGWINENTNGKYKKYLSTNLITYLTNKIIKSLGT